MNRNERRHRRQIPGRKGPARVRRRMALWEWLVLALLVVFAIVQIWLRTTGRPGPTVPDWVDAPPHFPAR